MDELDLIAKFRSSVAHDPGAETRARAALWQVISEDGSTSPARQSLGRRIGRRPRLVLAAIALLLLGLPTFGLASHVASWFNNWKDPEAPVAMAPDVVIASGEAGLPWELSVTPTDQGICMFVLMDPGSGFGHDGFGGCGFGSDIRGNPSATSDDLHFVGWSDGSGGVSALTKTFVFSTAAEEVASVQLVLSDGQTVDAHLVDPRDIDAPLNFYWAAWPLDVTKNNGNGLSDHPIVDVIIARDASGNVLERRDGPPPKP
jgi:hypothetical protein